MHTQTSHTQIHNTLTHTYFYIHRATYTPHTLTYHTHSPHLNTHHTYKHTCAHTHGKPLFEIFGSSNQAIHRCGSKPVRNSIKLDWIKLQKAQSIPILWIHCSLSDFLKFSLSLSFCHCAGPNWCRELCFWTGDWESVEFFPLVLSQPCLLVSTGPQCHLLRASSQWLRKSCQILWDAFVLQNTSQTAINQHLLKLIPTRSLTFKGITRHTALLNVYMNCSLQEREQH